ncbi:MAG: Gldg family protein [Phycisphaerae bacterium]|nr:Gldg family protein [Phycisphaerae bacterium]
MAVGTQATKRHWLYGINVIISVVVATAVLGFALVLGAKFHTSVDLTSTGLNSLSQRTRALLAGLDGDITLTALYSVPSEYVEVDQRRQDAVRDLLDLYEGAGRGKVTASVVDPLKDRGKIEEILNRLRAKPAYADEAAPHREFLKKFGEFCERLQAAVTADFEQCVKLADTDPSLKRSREFQIVATNLRRLGNETQTVVQEVAENESRDVPAYGRAADAAKDLLSLTNTYLADARGWMTGKIGQMPAVSDETHAFFDATAEKYKPLVDEALALQEEGGKLGSLKLDDMYTALKGWPDRPPILVETADEAFVVPFDDVWTYRDRNTPPGAGPDPSRDFAGEQAVSSAILRMTQKEKTGVVFVRYGGDPLLTPDFNNFNPSMGRLPTAPCQELNGLLDKANFVTAEWDVKTAKEPPIVEDAVRTIYVVFPPEPPAQPNPMQPPTEPGMSEADKQLVYDAVAKSGMAIFMARWQPPASPMMPMSRTYDYLDYLRQTWGIDVRYQYVTMEFTSSPEAPNLWIPAHQDPREVLVVSTPTIEFTDHPIGAPLASSQVAMVLVTPLAEFADAPEGVSIATIAKVRESERVWAFEDVQRFERDLREKSGTTPDTDDIRSPYPVAMAAEKAEGGKLVVFGSDRFISDDLAQQAGLMVVGGGFATYQRYPGNTDLFINTLHWLTGDADRIAVGPRKGGVPMLDKLKPGAAETFCKVFIIGVWPAVALLAGGAVWLFRRR